MTEIKHESELNTLLEGIERYCGEAVRSGDSQAVRKLSGETILILNRANRALAEKRRKKDEGRARA